MPHWLEQVFPWLLPVITAIIGQRYGFEKGKERALWDMRQAPLTDLLNVAGYMNYHLSGWGVAQHRDALGEHYRKLGDLLGNVQTAPYKEVARAAEAFQHTASIMLALHDEHDGRGRAEMRGELARRFEELEKACNAIRRRGVVWRLRTWQRPVRRRVLSSASTRH